MVTPQARRSFTLKTLLITSRPKLSKTKTFQIGSPSEFKIDVVCEIRPGVLAMGSLEASGDAMGFWFRFKILAIEAILNDVRAKPT